MTNLLIIINLALLASGLLNLMVPSTDRKFSYSLVRAIICLPLLGGEQLSLSLTQDPELIPLISLTELTFALIWYTAAYWLNRAVLADAGRHAPASRAPLFEVGAGTALVGVILVWLSGQFGIFIPERGGVFYHGPVPFLANLFILLAMISMAWRMERFWRGLTPAQRWEYKFLMVGSYLICGAMGWAVSYRYTYRIMSTAHYQLLGILILLAWCLILYAVIRHRLLNRKLFVSRKVVYAFVAPLAFGIYLILIGLIVTIMGVLHLTFPVVLQWLLGVVGLVVLMLMAVSGKVRHRIKYFISTHFYNNKYEYRDEWLAFSSLLQGALTEAEVVDALQNVMAKSLYTNTLCIWTGSTEEGFQIAIHKGVPPEKIDGAGHLSGDHPVVRHLQAHDRHYALAEEGAGLRRTTTPRTSFFPELNLVLFVSLTIGDQLVGIIGIGPEFTGGRYGNDDFDLLTALGTQAASAILAARMANQLATSRQQEAWDVMSAFVLHDVKNAASMLSLVRQNAPAHIHDPAFQEDMLATIDDALKRMGKVQNRLSAIKREIVPVWQEVDLSESVAEICRKMKRRMRGLTLNSRLPEKLPIRTDTELLNRILENIMLNALEAGGEGTVLEMAVRGPVDDQYLIEIGDTGPGLPEALLPDDIFKPFITTKPKGSGIGLWQVRRLANILGGDIRAANRPQGGACFLLNLPVQGGEMPSGPSGAAGEWQPATGPPDAS